MKVLVADSSVTVDAGNLLMISKNTYFSEEIQAIMKLNTFLKNITTQLSRLVFLLIVFFGIATCISKGATPFLAQAIANHASGAASTFSVSFPNTTVAGDVILVGFDFDANASLLSLGDSQGNLLTEVGAPLNSPGGVQSRVYYARNIKGGADTVTVNLSANSAYIEVYLTEYHGINPTSPIDAQAGAAGSAGVVFSGSAMTTLGGDVIYGYCVGDSACTAGAGFAARLTLDGNLLEDMSAGNRGAYAATGSANTGWTMQMVALKAANPVASLSASSLTFASQAVGSTSAAQTVTLTNSGTAALSITSIALSGANASDFAQSNNCGANVAAGANCTINVTFKPTAAGTRAADVTVTDNATGGTQTATLAGTGTGTGTSASVSPSNLHFDIQALGTTSAAKTVTLTNTGSAALSITGMALSGLNPGDFAQSSGCGSTLAGGASCTIQVTFTPSGSHGRAGLLTITDSAAGGPQTVSLFGTGALPATTASVSPTSLNFGSQTVGATGAAQTVTLTNSGSSALSISSIMLAGSNASDFALTNSCGSSVAAGANCAVSVTFKPSASGARAALLTITDTAAGGSQTVSLSGTGATTPTTVSFSPNSLSFGTQYIAMTSTVQTVTLTNTGTSTLNLTSLTVTGANASDFAQTSTCSNSVAAGANCTIAVLFTPSATGTRTAAISVADNAGGSPQAVSLSGSGNHNVMVSWADGGTGATGYNVYRGTASGAEGSTPVNSIPVSSPTFMDESVAAGATYYYVVTSVGSDGLESPASTETAATIPSN